MKNKQIINSWNKIELDSAADERMLTAILTQNNLSKSEKREVSTMSKTFNYKRLVPITACLALVVALTVVIGNNKNWFNSNIYTTGLSNGELLTFYKTNVPTTANADFGIDVTSRNLTPDENGILFGDLAAVTAYGTFKTTDNSLLRAEGKTGETKVIFVAPGIPLTDTVIDANTKETMVNGISVFAGYFLTKANSQGIKNSIYFVSFNLGGVSVYVELGGPESESENLRSEIAQVVEQLTQNNTLDLSRITE